jgi:hypothetical protein
VWYEVEVKVPAGKLAATGIAFALLGGTAAAAPKPTATKWIDKPFGYSIILPAKWYVIPRSTSAIKQEIAYLEKHKNASLASAYTAILKSPASLSELKAYRFQAFLWPPLSSPIPTEVSIQVVKGQRAYKASDLPAIGATYASALSSNKGSKITVPKTLELPAGPAAFIEGTVPNGNGVSTGLQLYILSHGKRVYVLSFKIDAGALSQATVFKSIAQHFEFL